MDNLINKHIIYIIEKVEQIIISQTLQLIFGAIHFAKWNIHFHMMKIASGSMGPALITQGEQFETRDHQNVINILVH